MARKMCKNCLRMISDRAKYCPVCGERCESIFHIKWWMWIILFYLLGAIGEESLNIPDFVGIDNSSESQEVITEAEEDAEGTQLEYAEALYKAKLYLETFNMSKEELYNKLIEEGYTVEVAQYAIDNLK